MTVLPSSLSPSLPGSLAHKWQCQISARFGQHFSIILQQSLPATKRTYHLEEGGLLHSQVIEIYVRKTDNSRILGVSTICIGTLDRQMRRMSETMKRSRSLECTTRKRIYRKRKRQTSKNKGEINSGRCQLARLNWDNCSCFFHYTFFGSSLQLAILTPFFTVMEKYSSKTIFKKKLQQVMFFKLVFLIYSSSSQ